MSLAKRTRTGRPAVEPIQTSYINLPDRSRTPLKRRPSPLFRAVQPGSHRSVSASSEPEGLEDGREAPIDVTTLLQLRITDSGSPDSTGLTTPSGTRWTVARQPHPTPVSAVSRSPFLVPLAIEVQATEKHSRSTENDEVLTPTATSVSHLPLPEQPSSDRRRSAPCCGASIRQLHFQRFREDLWKRGARTFGHAEGADVLVMPVQLRRAFPSDGGATPSSLSPPSGRLTVRAVIHSKKRATIGLKREFDLDALRATIPEPLQSPCSPNFDREALLSALGAHGDARSSPSLISINRGREARNGKQKVESGNRSPSYEGRYHLGAVAVPMHIQYARAQLPALAAIMMSDQVRRGDTIDLAIPHLRAWSETAAYVYTGEEELLTEQVKENILYLGGKV